jgi:hypothetical protein
LTSRWTFLKTVLKDNGIGYLSFCVIVAEVAFSSVIEVIDAAPSLVKTTRKIASNDL